MRNALTLLFLLVTAPAHAHQVFLYSCDFSTICEGTECASEDISAELGYDEHDLTFPLHFKGLVIALKGGRTENGEAFSGTDEAARTFALTITVDGTAELSLNTVKTFKGSCKRP